MSPLWLQVCQSVKWPGSFWLENSGWHFSVQLDKSLAESMVDSLSPSTSMDHKLMFSIMWLAVVWKRDLMWSWATPVKPSNVKEISYDQQNTQPSHEKSQYDTYWLITYGDKRNISEGGHKAMLTHQQDLSKPKNMVICNSWALVGFVEEQSYTAHNEQHTKVLSQWVPLPQYCHTEDHHCINTTMRDGLILSFTPERRKYGRWKHVSVSVCVCLYM